MRFTFLRGLLALIVLAPALSFGQVKVNALPSGTIPVSGDFAICDQSGVTNKCTYSQVASSISTILGLGTFAGQNYASPPFIGAAVANGANFTSVNLSGPLVLSVTGLTQCLHANSSGVVSGTGADCGAGGGGSSAFSALTGGTNNTAAMFVGTGASLTPTGAGSITANAYSGTLPIANGGTGAASLVSAGIATVPGTVSSGHCAQFASPTTLADSGATCGSGGSSTAFSSLTSSTNTTAAMVVGTGASIAATGSGSITATNSTGVNGASVPTSAAVLASNSSGQIIAATNTGTGSNVLATSPTLVTPNLGTPSAVVLTNGTGLPNAAVLGLGTLATQNAPTGLTQCIQASSSGVLSGTGAACGSGGGGGSGTVSTGTTNQIAIYPSSGVLVQGATTLPTGAEPAHTGDATNTAGSLAMTVKGINGTLMSSLATGLVKNTNSTGVPSIAGSSDVIGTFTGTCTSATFLNGAGACASPTGSGTVSAGTSGQLAGYATSGATVSGVTVGAGLSLSGTTVNSTGAINAQTGTGYTFLTTDAAKLVTFNNASSVSVSLPSATTTGFGAGYSLDVQNLGAGQVTITPATSTINGATTLTIGTNLGCSITSDGTNYQISACTAKASGTTTTIANGTIALGTSAIASGTCATPLTSTGSGILTTDAIAWSFNSNPTAVTGYTPGTSGMLTIINWPTSGNTNWAVCNNTSGSITPGAITLNWRVVR